MIRNQSLYKIIIFSTLLIVIFFNEAAFAKPTIYPAMSANEKLALWKKHHLSFSLLTGLGFFRNEQTQKITSNSGLSPEFIYDRTYETTPLIGAGINYQNTLSNAFVYSVGIEVSTLSSSLSGTENPAVGILPKTPDNQLNYSFNLSSRILLAKTTWYYFSQQSHWDPYIEVGAGIAWNKTDSYQETPKTQGGMAPGAPFTDKTINQFAYMSGIGIRYAFVNSSFITIGYRYENIGQAELGTVAGQTTNETIKTNRLGIHALVVTLNF